MELNAAGAVVLIIAMGFVNYIATQIIVHSDLTKELRTGTKKLGEKVAKRNPVLGGKIGVFFWCPLCIGTWVGFVQALVAGGPFQLTGGWAWATFVLNGLVYKSVGHVIYQASAKLHNSIERDKALAKLAMAQSKTEKVRRKQLKDRLDLGDLEEAFK